MDQTVILLIVATVFALLVANRAAKLNRSPFLWGIAAWIVSPLLVWVILELTGSKRKKPLEEVVEVVVEDEAIQVAAENQVN